MLIWFKISDTSGYIGIIKGETFDDVDNELLTDKEINELLNGNGCLPATLFKSWMKRAYTEVDGLTAYYLNKKGWNRKKNFCISIHGVHADCWEKKYV